MLDLFSRQLHQIENARLSQVAVFEFRSLTNEADQNAFVNLIEKTQVKRQWSIQRLPNGVRAIDKTIMNQWNSTYAPVFEGQGLAHESYKGAFKDVFYVIIDPEQEYQRSSTRHFPVGFSRDTRGVPI
jgi:hypothetical protein